MQLIIESGATKSTWIVCQGGKVLDRQELAGINPTSNPYSVQNIALYKPLSGYEVTQVFYYGAGVSSKAAVTMISKQLIRWYPTAAIEINHDILAACRSVSHKEKSVVSILGTGTNSVLYDGQAIVRSQRSLGYLFTDFGSGFHIGKLVVRAYYEQEMCISDRKRFEEVYMDTAQDFLMNIYGKEKPNYEVASYCRFLDSCTGTLRAAILATAFRQFLDHQIISKVDTNGLPLNFVGSVAFTFENELRAMASSYGLDIKHVEQDAIRGLISYHSNQK